MKRIQDRSQGEIDSIQERTSIEAKLIQEASSIRIKGLNSEKSAINATAKAMRSLVQRINLSLGLSGGQDLISALAGARAGDFAKAQALDVNALANLDPSQFASAEEFRIAQARNRNRLATIGMLAGTELSEADRQLQGIESQINSSKTNSDMQIAAIKDQSIEEIEAIRTQTERQVQELQEQLNVLLGVDTSVLSIEEAITKFRDAQITLQELNFEKEIGLLDMLTVSAEEVFTLHEQGYADELERLDQILIDNQALLDVALGIDNNILLVSEAITSLNSSIVALAERPATVVVIPAAPASLANMATSSEPATVQATQEVKNELIKMREDNMLVQREIVKNTKSTALILQRFELDGLDTRQIQ